MDTLQLIADALIIPLLKLIRPESAPSLFAALCSGGINAALVSVFSSDAPAILRQGSRLFPDLLLGADGVSSAEEANQMIACGARLIAGYGYSEEIASVCNEKDAFYLPFCLSPSELLTHQTAGGKAAGIFSPEAFGGKQTVCAFSNAFPHLPLVAGNIPLDKIADYLTLSGVIACTCTDIATGSLDEIIAKCQRASAVNRTLSD